MQRDVLILNGPNLNMLGMREPEIYGTETLVDIEEQCLRHGDSLSITVDFRQSNQEGDLIDWVHEAFRTKQGLIINAGAYTHTSIALHDALAMLKIPIIEVHLSNIYKREAFRHHSYISPVAKGVICGLGSEGYLLALNAMSSILDKEARDKGKRYA
jgi:3-dehydroquinate dehydratase-2